MSELIRVDFKKGVVTSRHDTENPSRTVWVAKNDPAFKEWLFGVEQLAEACASYGGDWRRMVMVMADNPPGKEPICMTMWDNFSIDKDEVLLALASSIEKVSMDTGMEDVQVVDLETAVKDLENPDE